MVKLLFKVALGLGLRLQLWLWLGLGLGHLIVRVRIVVPCGMLWYVVVRCGPLR